MQTRILSRRRRAPVLGTLLFVCLSTLAIAKATGNPPAVLSRISAIRDLSPEQAARKMAVRIRAVVTYYDPQNLMLLIHDATGGIFVETTEALPIDAGSVVEVSGVTSADFTNIIIHPVVKEIGRGPRPKPKRVSLKYLLSGDADCEFVTLTGKVRTAFLVEEGNTRFLELRLESQGKVIDVQILHYPAAFQTASLIDRTVTINGLADGSFNDQKQFVGILMNVQSLDDLSIIKDASRDPYQLPVRSVSQVLRYRKDTKIGMRAHLRGTVTYIRPRRLLMLQDGDLALPIHTQQTAPVAVGDVIDVIGFPAFGETTPVIEDADFRPAPSNVGHRVPLRPRPMMPTNAQAGIFDSQLVSTEARLLNVTNVAGKYTLALSAKNSLFSAVLEGVEIPPELTALREGSLLRVTGVCSVETAGMWRMIQGFRILMRSPKDVQVLETPSWDVRRLIYLLVGLGFAVIATFAWVAVLRHRVALQSLAMQKVELEKAAREKKFALHQETRNRILEGINRRDSLESILGAVALLPEQQYPTLNCVIHLINEAGTLTPVLESCSIPSVREFVLREPAPGAESLWTQAARSGKAVSSGDAWSWPVYCADNGLCGVVTALKRGDLPEGALSWVAEVTTQMAALAIDTRALYDGLRYRSLHDPLTGLPNRDYVESQLQSAIEAARASGRRLAIAYVDLDRFKLVNDVYGHDMGDLFLKIAAQRFRAGLRQEDMLGRVGGDEFVGFFPATRDREEAEEIRRRLLQQLREPFLLRENQTLQCSASIGLALFPDDGETLEELRRKADEAMYKAKLERNTASRPDESVERLSVLELRAALDTNRLCAHYQPIFTMDGQLYGFEALIRICDESQNLLWPDSFIETAEQSGMIVPIGLWILREASRQAALWERESGRGLTISVNVSARQFAPGGGFVDSVLAVLRETQLSPLLLQLELTESAMLQDMNDTIAQVHQLRRLGVRIALDDFGTGRSSLSVLHQLPVDVLKIDRSFVTSMSGTNPSDPIANAIFSIAGSLGALTIAEGVEHVNQIEVLRELNCGAVQGFGFARPMPVEEINLHLQQWLTFTHDLKDRLVNGEADSMRSRVDHEDDLAWIGSREG